MTDANHMRAQERVCELKDFLVADLRSLRLWATLNAEEKESLNRNRETLGGLNFSLCLLALVACEVFGFYSTGASLQQPDSTNDRHKLWLCLVSIGRRWRGRTVARPGMGNYIINFVDKEFRSKSDFKHAKTILARYLRNILVHGFGMGGGEPNWDIHLVVSGHPVAVDHQSGMRCLKINVVALAEQTIEALESFTHNLDPGAAGQGRVVKRAGIPPR